MTIPTATTSPTARLVGSLLPATWPSRVDLLDTARRVDLEHAGDGSAVLLQSWRRWRATGELPPDAKVRDLLAALGLLLGGIACEMRMRPRLHAPFDERTNAAATPGTRPTAGGRGTPTAGPARQEDEA